MPNDNIYQQSAMLRQGLENPEMLRAQFFNQRYNRPVGFQITDQQQIPQIQQPKPPVQQPVIKTRPQFDLGTAQGVTSELNYLIEDIPSQRQTLQTDLQKKYGIDTRASQLEALTKQSLETEKLLKSLPKNVQQRMSGRLVTAPQVSALLAYEQAPLTQQLSEIQGAVDITQQGLNLARTLSNDELLRARQETEDKINNLKEWRALLMQKEDSEANRIQQIKLLELQQQFEADQNALDRALQAKAVSGGGGGGYAVDTMNSIPTGSTGMQDYSSELGDQDQITIDLDQMSDSVNTLQEIAKQSKYAPTTIVPINTQTKQGIDLKDIGNLGDYYIGTNNKNTYGL